MEMMDNIGLFARMEESRRNNLQHRFPKGARVKVIEEARICQAGTETDLGDFCREGFVDRVEYYEPWHEWMVVMKTHTDDTLWFVPEAFENYSYAG